MSTGQQELNCLRCGAPFDWEDVNRTFTGKDDRCVVACQGCGTRNELRSDRMPGLGEPPQAVVVRIVED